MLKINKKHISEYGLKSKNIEIGIPATLSVREQIPGTNRYINTGNKGIFGQRKIKITFDFSIILRGSDKLCYKFLNIVLSRVINNL